MRAEDRGRIVARLLSGAWRRTPPHIGSLPEDLQTIIPVLLRQASGGLAWRRLRESGLEHLPGAEDLKDSYRHGTLQVRLLERQLMEVVGHLREHGIEPILAKGWALGRLYPEPGLRPYGDLDLMVLTSQYRNARAVRMGPTAPEAPVELHAGFPMLRDRTGEELFQRSRLVRMEGIDIRILGPEDQLRLATLHGLSHGLCRPLWLCDVAAVLETLPREFDWGYAMHGERWLSEGVRCSLGLAATLLGVDLQAAGVPPEWTEPPLPAWLVPAALRAFGASTHYMDMRDPGELLLEPWALLKAAGLRWANVLEVTYRREAPWNDGARLPHQLADFLSRGAGFVRRLPENLRALLAPAGRTGAREIGAGPGKEIR